MKKAFLLVLALCLGACSMTAFAQGISTTGSIGGQVVDINKAAIPGATITVTGPEGTRTVTTNDQGVYKVDNLIPGTYSVKVEQTNYKTASATNMTVFVGKQATFDVTLEPGSINEIVNVTAGATIDQQSTSIGENLNDQLFQNIPVQRSVSSLFYLTPGVSDGLGGGRDNPSISGGSALDNLYVADGVNITDSAFGGVGVFSRIYGALGTGINTSFIKEVQVKTGGFEPQYGQSEGGIVNIITQSGSNEYHGAIYGYAQPKAFEGTYRQTDTLNVNKGGEFLHQENYDVGGDVGGYVPGARNKLFFFGSFNPTVRRDIVLGAQGSQIRTLLGETALRRRTLNYAFKTDYNINANHQVTFSIFGDPTKTNNGPFRTQNVDVLTADSQLDFGTRNIAFRYNGSLTPTWTVSASVSQGRNHITESGFAPFNQITDRTQPARGNFRAIGLGFFENTTSKTDRFTFDTSKQVSINRFHLGTHTFGAGYQFQKAFFNGLRDRSGPKFTVPSNNAAGTFPVNPQAAGQPLNASFSLRIAPSSCTLCPLLNIPGRTTDIGFGPGVARVVLRQDRGEFGNTSFRTHSLYNAGYVQDTWRVNKYITGLLGLRMEQERIVGQNLAYSFTDQWAPRLGVTVDPRGKGKTKIYYNYGRFFEYLPLDAAERSLSTEQDFIGGRFAPDFTIDANGNRRAVVNQFGTVNPIIDNAHFLSRVPASAGGGLCGNPPGSAPCFGAPSISTQDNLEAVLPGTKLGFADEHLIGFEQQLPKNFVLSMRFIDRRLKRIIEDAAVVSPEGANAGIGQIYFIGNINSKLDAGINQQEFPFPIGGTPPAQCARDADGNVLFDTGEIDDPFGNPLGEACFGQRGIDPVTGNSINTPDGIPDGFPDPVHKYRALEIALDKRLSQGWQILSNFRFARLKGNFEGHLRNDNGQTDPGISSLFDFTSGMFNLLGSQFQGNTPLNSDRLFVGNIYASYSFSKERLGSFGNSLRGLNLGLGIHMDSGIPLSEFFAHPVYLNAGEIPVGGRGKLGRSSFYTRFDLHADYPIRFSEKTHLKLVADFFNVTNDRRVFIINQFRESTAGQLNPDFGKPGAFHAPFNMRLGARLEF